MSFSIVLLLGMAGLAVDLGRMYIAKNEAQSFVDSCALTAATKLNGDKSGVDAAVAAVQGSMDSKGWNLGTNSFIANNTKVEFSSSNVPGAWTDADGVPVPNVAAPPPGPPYPVDTDRVRVTTWVPVPLSFLRVLVSSTTSTIRSSATAIRSAASSFPPNSNVIPLSAVSHKAIGIQLDDTPLHPDPYGFKVGQYYTLHWDRTSGTSASQCPGDGDQVVAYVADKQSSLDNWEGGVCQDNKTCETGLTGNGLSTEVKVGEQIETKEGVADIQANADARVLQDTDPTSVDYWTQYAAQQTGNGRRVVMVAINTGVVTAKGSNSYADVIGIGQFLMMKSTWQPPTPRLDKNGKLIGATCGQYLGTGVPGMPFSGGVDANNPAVGNAALSVRLVR